MSDPNGQPQPLDPRQLMQAIASLTANSGSAPASGGGTGMMQPPAVTSNAQMPQFQTGRGTMMLPGGTASPSVPGVPQSATPPRQPSQMRASGVAAIPGAVFAVKQKMHQDKVEKARQMASQYIAFKQNDDPQVQRHADEMMSDPKVHKIFDKAISDPTSAEYQGVQMAYRDQMSQEQQKISMQEMRAKMQQQQAMTEHQKALAEQARSTAGLRETQAASVGQVTEKDRFMELQKNERVHTQMSGRLTQSSNQIQAMLEATRARIAGAKERVQIQGQTARDVAKTRAGATRDAAGMRAQKADDYIIKEYRVLDQQISELDKQSKDLMKDLSDHPALNWLSGEDETKQSKLQQLETQRVVLESQLKMLQAKDKAFQSTQITKPPSTSGGDGSQKNPFVIK